MTAQRLTVMVAVGSESNEREIERTLISVARSRRALRRLGWRPEILLLSTHTKLSERVVGAWSRKTGLPTSVASPSNSEAWAGEPGLVASCRAGEILDRRFLPSGVRLLESHNPRMVVHSEHTLVAAERPLLLRMPDLRRDDITLESLVDGDPWPGARLTTTAVVSEVGIPLSSGEMSGPTWTTATLAAGVSHVTVASINVIAAHDWEDDCLPLRAIDLDSLSDGIAEFQNHTSRSASNLAAWELKHPVVSGPIRVVRRGRRGLSRRVNALMARIEDRLVRDDARRRLRLQGASLDDLPDHALSSASGSARHGDYATIVLEAWRSLGGSIDVLIVTPQVSSRSSDQAALHYAHAVLASTPSGTRIALATSGPRESTDSALIPPEVTHYPLHAGFSKLDATLQSKAIAQLAVALSAKQAVIVDDDLFAAAIGVRFSADVSTLLWTTAASGKYAPETPRLDHNLHSPLLIADGPRRAAMLAARLKLDASKVRIHVPPPLPLIPDYDSVTQYTAAHDDVEFDDLHPFHVLWRTSDADQGERGKLLTEIVRTVADLNLPVRIHVHHEVGAAPVAKDLPESGPHVNSHGQFSGGLRNLPTENYHAFIVDTGATDARQGVLQAMLLGLPVIARKTPNDDLIDEGTACVVPDDTASAFVRGIEKLLRSRTERQRLVRSAYDHARDLVETHPFHAAVSRDLNVL